MADNLRADSLIKRTTDRTLIKNLLTKNCVVGEGQDVGDRVHIEPHRAQIWEFDDKLGVLTTAVGDGAKDAVHWTDVGQQVGVAKNGDR